MKSKRQQQLITFWWKCSVCGHEIRVSHLDDEYEDHVATHAADRPVATTEDVKT